MACVNSVFEQPWWLDAVAPGRWSAAVVRQGDDVVARLPYTYRRRPGLMTIVQPELTQTLGPWLACLEGKYARRLEREKRLLGQLIELLPPFDFLRVNLSPSLTNWLPFYWAGFDATVRYTYRIEDLTDLERVRAEFQEHVRRGIRKAEGAVAVECDHPLDDLLRLNALTFARQGRRPPYSDEYVRRRVRGARLAADLRRGRRTRQAARGPLCRLGRADALPHHQRARSQLVRGRREHAALLGGDPAGVASVTGVRLRGLDARADRALRPRIRGQADRVLLDLQGRAQGEVRGRGPLSLRRRAPRSQSASSQPPRGSKPGVEKRAVAPSRGGSARNPTAKLRIMSRAGPLTSGAVCRSATAVSTESIDKAAPLAGRLREPASAAYQQHAAGY